MEGASTSYGAGIALGAKPDISQVVGIVARRDELKTARRVAEKAAREKKREKLGDILKNIRVDYSKFNYVYVPGIKLAYAETLETLKKEREKRPLESWSTSDASIMAIQKLKEELGKAERGTFELSEMETFVSKPENQQLIELNLPLHKAYLEGKGTLDPDLYWEEAEKTGAIRGGIVPRSTFYEIKPEPIDMLSLQKEITGMIDVSLRDKAPVRDKFGIITYAKEIDEKEYRRRLDAESDIVWETDPAIQTTYPPEKAGDEFSQKFRDDIWLARKTKTPSEKLRMERKKEEKEVKFEGYSTKNYRFPKQKVDIKNEKVKPIFEKGKKSSFHPAKYEEIEEYLIIRKDKTELSFLEFDVKVEVAGMEKKKTLSVRPYSIRIKDGKPYLYGEEKESGEDIYISFEEVGTKFKEKMEGASFSLIKGFYEGEVTSKYAGQKFKDTLTEDIVNEFTDKEIDELIESGELKLIK